MTPEEFKDQYQGEWRDDATRATVRKLALEYHRRCEEFDRVVCSGKLCRDGVCTATPANADEQGLINKNAFFVNNELYARACRADPDLTRKAWHDLVAEVSHQSR